MLKRTNRNNERGMVMLEASIYFPLVIAIVVMFLYIVLFNIQEYLMMYQCQKIAAIVTRETAFPGYSVFGMGEGNEIELTAQPTGEKVTEYYKSRHGSFGTLYSEAVGLVRVISNGRIGGADTATYAKSYVIPESTRIIAAGTLKEPEVDIKYGLMGNKISVGMTHEIPTPGIIKYLGWDKGTDIRTSAYSYAVNPASFVRNVNIAWEVGTYINQKFKISETVEGIWNGFKDKTSETLSKITG